MATKRAKKLFFLILLCAILTSNFSKASAEKINIEKINFELGISCLQQNNYKQAIKYFELVVQKNPKNIEAHYNLAIAYKKSRQAEKSVSEFDKVVKLLNDPQNFKSKGIDINKIRQENRILHINELASDKYELYSKVKSQENDYIDLGDMHFDNQQFETAIEYYNLALQINPYNDYTYFKIAKSYMDMGNSLQSEPYISRAVELSPQNQKYTYYQNLIIKQIGDKYVKNVDLREKILKQSLNRKDPIQGFDLPEEYKRELFAEEEKNHTASSDISEPYVEESFSVDTMITKPEKKSSFFKRFFVKKQTEKQFIAKTDEKKEEIKPEIHIKSLQGKSQELDYLDLADLHYDNQEYDTAIEYYNLALNINPNNDYTHYKTARCFIDLKQYQNADEFLDKALALSPMNKKYLYFKNQIETSQHSVGTQKLAYKATASHKEYENKFKNLNPSLKIIPTDPKINEKEDLIVSNEPEFAEISDETKIIETPKTKSPKKISLSVPDIKFPKFKISISKLKPDFSWLDRDKSQKIASIQNNKIHDKQIIAIEEPPSVFGKDMKYYQTIEQESSQQENKIPDGYQYEKPIQKQPTEPQYSADYYNEKGIAYFKQDNLQKAENFFKKAIELKPMYAKAYNNLANIEAKRGNFVKAIEYSNQALIIDPSYPESYYNLAIIYKKQKDFVNEIAYLDKTVQADPKYYEAYFSRGLAYYSKGNYEQAKYNFKETLKYKNDHYLACQNLGIIYANELNKTEAVNYLKTAIRLNKNNPTSYYYLASIYQTTGQVFDAIDNFSKTIQLDPDNYKAYLALAKAYEQNDEINRAIDTLDEAVRLNPSNAEPYNAMGLLYLKKDKYIEATNSFQKAIAINPKRSVYHYNLSQSYICLNMKNRAKSEFERATSIQPTTIQDFIDLSEIFFDRSMPSYSIKVLKDGILALPDNDYLYVTLAGFYEKTGATASAKKTLQDYLLKKPNGTLSLLIQRKLKTMENTVNNKYYDY